MADSNAGGVLSVHLVDGTRLTVIVTPSTTGAKLVRQVADKIELKESAFFGIADVTEYSGTGG